MSEAKDLAAAKAAARAQGAPVESLADRSETATVRALPDGRLSAELFAAPVRYKDSEGSWQDVDVTLRQDADGAIVPVAHPAALRFAGPGGTADTVRELASLQDGRVVLGWKGTLPQPVLDGYTATYPGIAPGVDLILTATRTGFEQFFRLNARPLAGTAPTFRLPLTGEGLTVAENAQGGLDVADAATGKTVGRAPAPRMWGEAEHAKSGEPAKAAHVAMTVEKTPAGTEVVLEPDPAFLSDPSVSYPLLVDPSITVYPNSDTLIQNDLSSNQNGGTELKAGSYNSGTTKARSLVKINVAAISALDNAHVLDADFLAYNFYSSTCTATPVGLHRITETWSPTSVTWSNGAPSMIGTPFVSMTESNGYNANCPDGYIHFTNTGLRDLVQQWIDGAPNYGFAIRAGNETASTSWKRFHSSDYGGSRVPRLNLTYAVAPDAPTAVSATAGNGSASVAFSAPADNGGSAITGYTVTPYIGTTPGTAVNVAASPAPITGLTNGTAYTFKVQAKNIAGISGYSTASAAVTPRTVPSAPAKPAATAANAAANVTWTAPANGGATITSYTITPYAGGVAGMPVTATASPKLVTGLTNGTAYTFTVTATNAAGTGAESPPSDPVTPRTLPGTPAAPTASAGNGSAQVSWAAPNDGGSPITSYTVTPYTGTTAGTAVTVTGTPPATTAEVSGLSNGTAYTFTVTATNALGAGAESPASQPVTPQAPAIAPGAPTNVSATAGDGSAQVSWTAPATDGGAPITAYTITPHDGTAEGTPATVTGTPPATTTEIGGLANGTAYTFTVTATNSVGTSEASTASAPVTPRAVPDAPTAVAATGFNGFATLTWTPPATDGGAAITGYTITTSPGGATTEAPAGATGATVTGLTNGTAYTFTVFASNAAGAGETSTPSAPVTPVGAAGAPTGVAAASGDGQLVVSWTPPASNGGAAITGYTVWVLQTGASVPAPADATVATVTGLTNGTAYTVIVTATNSVGIGALSAQVTAIPAVLPGAPTGVSAVAGNTEATVSWVPPASDGGATITRYTVTATPGGTSVVVNGTGVAAPATTATLAGLTNGTAYTFTVAATNPAGTSNESAASAPVTPTDGPPKASTSVHAVAGNAQAVVTWSASAPGGFPVTGYTVTANPGGATATTPDGATTTATVTGLSNAVAYTFTVVATSAAGPSAASAPSAAVTPYTTPDAPVMISAGSADGTATASWDPPSFDGGASITAYTLTATPGGAAITVGGDTTIATIENLTNDTAYTFTVTATNAAGSGAASAPSNTTTPEPPPAPVKPAAAWAWGNNWTGQLGNGSTANSAIARRVQNLTGVIAVTGNEESGYALRGDGKVWAWGSNWAGQLGDGTTTQRLQPVQVAGLNDVTAIAAGEFSAYALKGDGTVWAWGENFRGALGDGTTTNRSVPVQVMGLTNVTAIAAAPGSWGSALALRADGTVWAWGENASGARGPADATGLTAIQIGGLSQIKALAVAGSSAYAVRADGTVWAWGHNDSGQLGRGDDRSTWIYTSLNYIPRRVHNLTGAEAVAAASDTAYALLEDGTVRAWGSNYYGMLGAGTGFTGEASGLPVPVADITGATAIRAGDWMAFAVTAQGTLKGWGYNGSGQLGNGSSGYYGTNTPVTVYGLGPVHAFGAGSYSGYAVSASGPVLPLEHAGGHNPAELNDCSACEGDPIDLASGAFYENVTDLTVPGRGTGLEFTRSYDTRRAGITGRLGYGWTDNYDWSVQASAGGNVTIRQNNGSQVVFTPNSDGGYTAPSRVLATLEHNENGTWTYTLRRTVTYTFTAAGNLASIGDRNGYATTLGYDANGRLSNVTAPDGRQLTFNYYADGRLHTVTDPLPRTVTYAYDGAGNLAQVTDVDGRNWTLGYDGSHRITTVTDPRSHTMTNVYDPSSGRVVEQIDRRGKTMTFAYSTPNSVGEFTTTVTHPEGNVDRYSYSDGQVMSLTRGLGTAEESTTRYEYDGATNGRTKLIDGEGHVTSWTYDGYGNKLTQTEAVGTPRQRQTTWTYNQFNQPLTVVDPLGVTTAYTYDGSGNLKTVSRPLTGTNPQTATTTYTYADSAHPGELTKITSPDGKDTLFGHDAHGYTNAVTDPTGRKTTSTYNVIGWKTAEVSPAGNASGGDPAQHRTTSADFTGFGAPRTVTDPLGHAVLYTYDANQNMTSATDADGRTTSTTYDANNNPVKVTRNDGTYTQTRYDGNGNIDRQTDGLGKYTDYGYDALDRLTSTTLMGDSARQTRYSYDRAGNLVSTTQPGGLVTTHGYDELYQPTGVNYSDPDTPDVTYGYDAGGRRNTMTDSTGTTTYTFDSLNRAREITNGAGQTTTYGYNNLSGRATSITYPGITTPLQRTYDDAGRLSGITDWLGNNTTFGYDSDGRWATTNYANGVTGTRGYDNAGGLVSLAYAHGTTGLGNYTYTRTDAGLLDKTTPAGGAPGSIDDQTYTANGQLKSVAGPGSADVWAYDDADRLTRLADGTTFTYRPGTDELETATPPTGAATAYDFDGRGNRTDQRVGTADPQRFNYDQANRLISSTSPSGEHAAYTYNGDGLRASKTTFGTTRTMAWDTATSNLPLLLADGESTYIYGPAATPVAQITGTTIHYLHQDQLGSTVLLTAQGGTQVGTYTYDSYGEVTAHTGVTTDLQYNGQYTDAESGLIYLRARYYDPATGQFLTRDPIEALTRQPYQYAHGNPVNETDPSGLDCGLTSFGSFGDCVGAVVDGTRDVMDSELAQRTKGTLNKASTLLSVTAGGCAGYGALTLNVPLLGICGAIDQASDITDTGATIIECLDRQGDFTDCATQAAGAVLPFVSGQMIREALPACEDALTGLYTGFQWLAEGLFDSDPFSSSALNPGSLNPFIQ